MRAAAACSVGNLVSLGSSICMVGNLRPLGSSDVMVGNRGVSGGVYNVLCRYACYEIYVV